MGKITARSCDYQKDKERLFDLLLAYRVATDVRRYPTVWRVRLLLTSRVWAPPKDSRIWQNALGEAIGFAMLWRRQPTSPYIVLDTFAHPAFAAEDLLWAMLQWGNQRANDIVAEQKMLLTVYTSGFPQSTITDYLLNHFGFVPTPSNPDEHNVYFARPLQTEIPIPALPPGYMIRQLRETDDLESYQSLVGFAGVNPAHQRELLASDEYCHLVVVNPGGEFMAYCECSICRAEWKITNYRIGWVDYVETRAEQQKQGFGRAALLAGLRQLQAWDADTAMLITVNTNAPAVGLYNKTGFERVDISELPIYEKQLAP